MNIKHETTLGQVSSEARATPFYHAYPHDRDGLLQWRVYVRERCLEDADFRRKILEACRVDPVFFASTFVYLHETRPLPGGHLGSFPFLPDTDQIDVLAWFYKYIGHMDLTARKSRGIGFSYLVDVFILWLWLFKSESLEIALVSKDETSLDLPNRPSSLMGKLDLMWKHLPFYLKNNQKGSILRRTHTKHRWENLDNGNAILGFVPSDDKLRSGRYYCVILDEAAILPADVQRWISAAYGTTNSTVWVSTIDGTANMFYRLTTCEDPKVNMVRIDSWWWNNPRWAEGLYRSEAGRIEILDQSYRFPRDYPFSHKFPGYLRSPMVDAYFNRPGVDVPKLREEFYGIALIDSRRMMKKTVLDIAESTCLVNTWKGHFTKEGKFTEDIQDGEWQWWRPVDVPLAGASFVIGVDPALGVAGGDPAGVCVLDKRTGEQVITARLRGVAPMELAKIVVALAKHLSGPTTGASVIYESTGIGKAFGDEVRRLQYNNIFEEGTSRGEHNTDRGKHWLMGLGRAIEDHEFVVRDRALVAELGAFEYNRDNELIYAGTGHGDLAIASALCVHAAKDVLKGNKPKFETPLEKWQKMRPPRVWSDKFKGP